MVAVVVVFVGGVVVRSRTPRATSTTPRLAAQANGIGVDVVTWIILSCTPVVVVDLVVVVVVVGIACG